MVQARNARKRAEEDVQLLANRLQHLRNEERKAWKRISETQDRAEHVQHLKERNSQARSARMSDSMRTEVHIAQEKTRVKEIRDARRKQVQYSKASMEKEKRRRAAVQRAEFMQLKERQEKWESVKTERKRMQRETIRQLEVDMRERRIKEQRENLVRVERQFGLRLHEENSKQQEAERMLQAMEKEEEELINRLNSTKVHQQSAYEELQRLLTAKK